MLSNLAPKLEQNCFACKYFILASIRILFFRFLFDYMRKLL